MKKLPHILAILLMMIGRVAMGATWYVGWPGDNSTGTSTATAFTSITKLESHVSAGDIVYFYGTNAHPIIADAQLVVNGWTAIGSGDAPFAYKLRTISSGVVTWTVVNCVGCDYRPFKVLSGTWTEDGTATNVWTTPSTEGKAVVFQWAGWSGHTQPLIWLQHVPAANLAAGITALNSVPNGFYTDGSTKICIYDTTNPNSDGKVFVASQPSTIGNAIMVEGNGSLTGFVVGGTAGDSETDETSWDPSYGIDVSCTASNQTPKVSNCFGYCTGKHAIAFNSGNQDGVNNDLCTFTNCRIEQGPPVSWTGYAQFPIVVYMGGASHGNVAKFINCTCMAAVGVVGSTEGAALLSGSATMSWHGDLNTISEIYLENCYINGNVQPSTASIVPSFLYVKNCYVAGVSASSCNSKWENCLLGQAVADTYNDAINDGLSTELDNCIINASLAGFYNGGVSIAGNYRVINCTLDVQNGNYSGATAALFGRQGPLHFVMRNSVLIQKYKTAAQAHIALLTGLNTGAGDIYDGDGNYFVTVNSWNFGYSLLYNNSGTAYNFAGMQGLGFELHSTAVQDTAGTWFTTNMNANYTPTSGSAVIGIGITRANETDITSRSFTLRNDDGAFQSGTAISTPVPVQTGLHPWIGW